ncbi:hypothetical protein Dvul_0484 [Nitratidesulfovibrio vulgaris DP4]|uniref:Uncharacterized protein n=1 Tax=Nitratidesulfovibrio vulgaris (strain DP4) TaxID=391774 RepID=A0A0H3A4U1_NITV4|nr:hypothetical protein Dvul_0484 [Nitratidesulfovibrio vulgaris DP4]
MRNSFLNLRDSFSQLERHPTPGKPSTQRFLKGAATRTRTRELHTDVALLYPYAHVENAMYATCVTPHTRHPQRHSPTPKSQNPPRTDT